MENTQLSLECSLRVTKPTYGHHSLRNCSPIRKADKDRAGGAFSKGTASSLGPHENSQDQTTVGLDKDHASATACLSSIKDPLWKHVCRDIINMMGAESFFKIWNSTLGEVHPQDQSMEIHCQTEETAQFIEQYAFVILGSLQPYFPVLKQLRATPTSL